MSTETQENYSTAYFDWIEKAISEDYIKYYDFAKFINKEEISNGSYGKISRANWNDSDTVMVLKSSYDSDIKKIVNEIKMQREIDYHENIIKFYGISKLETESINKYLLHAQNILIHKNNIKLADFGLSRKINDAFNHSTDVFGVVPYVDPEYLKNISNKNKGQLYLLNPKSDVYSVGVLLWQISSGHKPFYSKNEDYDASLVMDIIKGRREKIIKGTSTEYSDLYKACWSDDSNERPTLQQVVDSLRAIISEDYDTFHASTNNYSIAQVYLAKCYEKGYGIERNYNLAFNWMQKAVGNKSIFGQLNLGNYYEKSIGTEKDLDKAFYLYQESANNENLSGLYNLGVCYEFGKGIEKNEIKAFETYLTLSKKDYYISGKFRLGICYYFGIGTEINKEKAFNICEDLAEKYDHAQALLEKNLKIAFYWFQKAVEKGNVIALYNLGECYELGNGIKKDEFKAFSYIQKLVIQNFSDAKFILGYYYINGIGTDINKKKGLKLYNKASGKNVNEVQSIFKLYENGQIIDDIDEVNYWYHKAANNNNKEALYKLGEFYEIGKGVDKNLVRAFEFYKKSSNLECFEAQYKVGYYYEHGIVVNTNKDMAFELYKIAAKGDNSNAQKRLAYLYEQGVEIEKM
ncbi:3736_t:CDS:2 [Funneliformis geosporum]|nr:3736_t:CDS:2 [Funneliformis geosporum]